MGHPGQAPVHTPPQMKNPNSMMAMGLLAGALASWYYLRSMYVAKEQNLPPASNGSSNRH
ncbi:hypothetical protein HDU76_001108 [Blyttiomyces sp. JEL0837]|nr:hypothetical protein HDU76_001108 [Blyttiomyces sp. JEL0837]